MQHEIDWKVKFPKMTRTSSPPALFTVNGCGLSIYGKRDWDQETRTYVKTYCLCFVFIPIMPITAYRVADAPNGGWYFIGREPLSAFAKGFNFLTLGAVIMLALYAQYQTYTNSPEYKSARAFEKAEATAASGAPSEAAQQYVQALSFHASNAGPAKERLLALIDAKIDSLSVEDLRAICSLVQQADSHVPGGTPGRAKFLAAGLAQVERRKAADPKAALALLDIVQPLAPDPKTITALRPVLLEAVLAKDPANAAVASELAVLKENSATPEELEKLLAPAAKSLGTLEGARILGQVYAREGNTVAAFNLLNPYVEGKLQALHLAEQSLNQAMENAYQAEIALLNRGVGETAFFNNYKSANGDKARQEELVDEYVHPRIRKSPAYLAAIERLKQAASVVPAALDLGITRLRRAQGQSDPAERKKELEAAEKVFLAIKGVAGKDADYQLFFGQVQYWLGKHDEGQKSFDAVLAQTQRSTQSLVAVAKAQREIGNSTAFRTLMEEAYNKETAPEVKMALAEGRATDTSSNEDKIKWLNLAKQTSPHVQSSLNEALSFKALQAGDRAGAATFARKGIAVYEQLPRNASNLNNQAVSWNYLYYATLDPKDLEASVKLQEESLALQPSDSILMRNTCSTLSRCAFAALFAGELDSAAAHLSPDCDKCSLLYVDQAGKDKFRQKMAGNPFYKRCLELSQKLQVVSPKSTETYSEPLMLYSFMRDQEGLRQLVERATAAQATNNDLQETLEEFSLEKTQTHRTTLENYQKEMRKSVAELAPNLVRERAALYSSLVTNALALHALGAPYDGVQALQWAEQSHQALNCSRSRARLADVLLANALETVAGKHADAAALLEKSRRSGDSTLIATLVLLHGGPAAETLKAQSAFTKATDLIKQGNDAFPNSWSLDDWALFNAAGLDTSRLAQAIKSDPSGRLELQLEAQLYPLSAAIAYQEFFLAQFDGNASKARARLEELAKKGIPLALP